MALYSAMRRNFWRTHQKPLAKTIEDDEEDIVDDAPKEEIIDKTVNYNIENMDSNSNLNDWPGQNLILDGRKDLDKFLNEDFGQTGRQDALMNSDSSNAETAKKGLIFRLEFEIDKALSWYENKIKDCENQIRRETKDQYYDIVGDVQNQKEKLEAEKKRIEKIKTDANNVGIGLMPLISYDRISLGTLVVSVALFLLELCKG